MKHIERLVNFIETNYGLNYQLFIIDNLFSPKKLVEDKMETVYSDGHIILKHCSMYEYLELYGLDPIEEDDFDLTIRCKLI